MTTSGFLSISRSLVPVRDHDGTGVPDACRRRCGRNGGGCDGYLTGLSVIFLISAS
jgi:hypothetical protein